MNSLDMGESIEDIHDLPSLSIDHIKRLIEFAHPTVNNPLHEGIYCLTKILRIGCERTSAHMRSSLSAIGWAGQNLVGRNIAIVALSSVEWDILKQHLP